MTEATVASASDLSTSAAKNSWALTLKPFNVLSTLPSKSLRSRTARGSPSLAGFYRGFLARARIVL